MLRTPVFMCVLAAGCKSAPAPASEPAPGEHVAGEHMSVVDDAEHQLAARKTSSYAHDTHVDEASGRFDYDCSGFVNYTLKRSAPAAFTEVAAARARPTAQTYHDFFLSKSTSAHWQSVPRATDIRRGDLIAWLEPADTDTTNTGHVVLAVDAPTVTGNGAKKEIAVEVIDSARSGHGTTDTRPKGEGGLGRGPIVLELDADNHARAFRWSPEKNSQTKEVSIAIGRIAGGGT